MPAAHAAKPGNTCPPGFNIGPMTIDEAVEFERELLDHHRLVFEKHG